MPDRMRLGAALLQVGSDHRSEMIHPTPDCLVGHRHSTLREQIFDVAQAQREPEVEPNRLLNDLRREPVAGVADFPHPPLATGPPKGPQVRRGVTMPFKYFFP